MFSSTSRLASTWDELLPILTRSGPFCTPHFEPGPENLEVLAQVNVLIVGAGGLGCELLKNLALSGFKQLHVIDMDTIEVSNLNRQFLFRASDVGKSKAEVAAAFVMNRIPDVEIHPYCKRIEEMPSEFYRQMDFIACGLDNVDARMWINETIYSICARQEVEGRAAFDTDTVIPFVDGGSEGFKGSVKVNVPGLTTCMKCIANLFPKPRQYPMCTLRNTPRLAEHCIQYCLLVDFPEQFPQESFDADSIDHVQFVYERARDRAVAFDIPSPTYHSTLTLVKHIIPAIASTNATIAGGIANEIFKLATGTADMLRDMVTYVGSDSMYTHVFENDIQPDCPVCGAHKILHVTLPSTSTVKDLANAIVRQYVPSELTHSGFILRSHAHILYTSSATESNSMSVNVHESELLQSIVSSSSSSSSIYDATSLFVEHQDRLYLLRVELT